MPTPTPAPEPTPTPTPTPTPQINALDPFSLSQLWPDEAQGFTPWPAKRLHMLVVSFPTGVKLK